MPEETGARKEESSAEKTTCCTSQNSSKTLILVIILVLVVAGLAIAFKFAAFAKNGKNLRANQFENFDTDRSRGGANRGVADGSEGCPLHTGSAAQTISAISGDKLTVESSSKDQIVNIAADTSIVKNSEVAAKTDLKVGDKIIVKGTSNSDGEIIARSITVK
jgi:hypothetical protein